MLAQFKEKKAYPILIELLNLPIENIDRLLGDVLTDSLPSILINVYDGDLDSLFQLLLKKEADPGLRYLISYAISALIAHGLVNLEEVTVRLQMAVASGKTE